MAKQSSCAPAGAQKIAESAADAVLFFGAPGAQLDCLKAPGSWRDQLVEVQPG